MHFSWNWLNLLIPGLMIRWSLLLAGIALKGLAILAGAGLATLLMRRALAATRHLVWVLAMTSLLALPFLSTSLLQWYVLPAWCDPRRADVLLGGTVKIATLQAQSKIGSTATTDSPIISRAAELPQAPVPFAFAEPTRPLEIPKLSVFAFTRIWLWVGCVWSAGAVLIVLHSLIGRIGLARLAGASSLGTEGAAFTLLQNLRAELGLKRRVRLLLGQQRSIPMTWGVIRPTVLLPKESEQWSPERLRAVLLHELAHIQRVDCLTQWLARIVCAIYWFNPLAWVAAHRLGVEQEGACDDAVLRNGLKPSDYAEHLLQIVARLRTNWRASSAIPIVRRSQLRDRLQAILDANRRHSPLTRAAVTAALILVAGSTVSIAILGAESNQDNRVRQTLAQIRDARQRAQLAVRNLYIVASTQQYEWNEDSGQWKPTPARTHMRVWIEAPGSGRWRVDYDPEILKWNHGAAPYSESRYLETFDGKDDFKIDHVYDDENQVYRSDMSYRSHGRGSGTAPEPLVIWPFEAALQNEMAAFEKTYFLGERVISETEPGGREQIQISRLLDGQGGVRTDRYVFDTGRGFALAFLERALWPVGRGGSSLWRYEVTEWRRLSADAWIPAASISGGDSGSLYRETYQLERIAHFSPKDADVIFSAQDVALNKAVAHPSTGPSIHYVDLP